jgi:uncharacterized protein with HEPN domain
MNEEIFINDERTQLAVLYEITVIGEVVKRLSPEFRSSHPQIEWRKIAGMRDQVIHSYENVDLRMVWLVVQKNIPELITYINEKCIPDLETQP